MEVGEEGYYIYIYTYRYSATTRRTSVLRWPAMRAILMCHELRETKSQDSVHRPTCLSDLIQLYVPSRQLRSSADTRLLPLPSAHLKSSGRRLFLSVTITLEQWNSLHYPNLYIASAALKTHLFSCEH